jgi:hypothetical protein
MKFGLTSKVFFGALLLVLGIIGSKAIGEQEKHTIPGRWQVVAVPAKTATQTAGAIKLETRYGHMYYCSYPKRSQYCNKFSGTPAETMPGPVGLYQLTQVQEASPGDNSVDVVYIINTSGGNVHGCLIHKTKCDALSPVKK